ncbi:GPI transamidase component, variant 3 [Bonamia ostreae]
MHFFTSKEIPNKKLEGINNFYVVTNKESSRKFQNINSTWTLLEDSSAILKIDQNFEIGRFWDDFVDFLKNKIFLTKNKTTVNNSKTFDLLNENKYIFSFSLLNSLPSDLVFTWNFDDIYQKYLRTFLDKMSFLDIKIDAQIKNYGQISKNRYLFDSKDSKFYLKKKNLNSFIGKTRWNSKSLDPEYQTVNFLVFVPPLEKQPLEIRTTKNKAKAFIVPKWGGVTIWNVPKSARSQCKNNICFVQSEEFLPQMETFAYQIRLMLGLEDNGGANGFNEMELQAICIERILRNIKKFKEKIFSLYTQFDTLQQLPIRKEVSLLIRKSMDHYENAEKECAESDLKNCLKSSMSALELISKAYFDSSIVSKLYFSTEYVLTIFAPYLIIATIPVLKAVFADVKKWMRN